MSSLSTLTCSSIWMVLCKHWWRRRYNGMKTYTSPWRLCRRSCPNNILDSLQRPVYFSFQCVSLILSGSWDRLGSGTRRWILMLRRRHLILPNTGRSIWSRWRTNTAANVDECLSLNPKMSSTVTFSHLQKLLDLVIRLLIHMICSAMMKNT